MAYRKVLELKADNLQAHSAIMSILLGQNNVPEAEKQLEQLKKVAPNHPQTKFLIAQVAYQKRDFKAARDVAQQLLKIAPTNAKALQLAGAIEFQMGSMIQAEVLLSKAVQAAPELALARRLLIMTYLRTGQPQKAMTSLAPSLSKGSTDPEINSIAGEVFLQNGDVKKAEEYFAKAAKLDPKDPRKRTSLALVHMAGPGEESAFGELQEIAASDKGVTADLALISSHLRRKNFDLALKAIDGLEKKQPDKPLAFNLRGKALLAKQDSSGARKSFERALAIDPTYFSAVTSLAALDLADKKPEDAKKRFEAVLAKDPKNGPALLALAELAARSGAAKDEVAARITKAIDANPSEAGPRLLLIDFYLRSKDERQALSTAQSANATLPDSPELLDALGRTQQATGDFNQAAASFNKLASMQPLSPSPYMRLADMHMAAKNKEAAAQSLKKGLEIKPDLLDAQRGLIMLHVEAKKFTEAVTIARSVQKQRPKEAVGYVLEGDVAASQKNWDAASVSYRNGLKEVQSPELALKLHSALVVSGKVADADKFVVGWMKDHPNDAAFQFYLGDYAIAKNDLAAAEKSYAAVVKLQPGNATAYNNLAWVTGKLNKEGSIAFAETAIKLAPNQPAFMDTLAMLLLDKNELARATELQKKVLTLQPDAPIFKLNMAKIQMKAGDKAGAKKNLDELSKLGSKFGGQAEVERLSKQL